MKKRILCLGLCLLMVLTTVLTGCNDESENENVRGENKNAATVTLAMTKGEGTTDEAAQLVEDAINVITEGKLNTHVELMLYEEDELKDAIQGKINEISDMVQSGEEMAADPYEDEEEEGDTEVYVPQYDEETGREIKTYPEVEKTQFDIVLIKGMEQYNEYMDMEVFYDGEMVTGALAEIAPSILLSQYVNDALLTTASDSVSRPNGTVYAFPNNRDFGQYTYLLINKELADRFGYDPAELTTKSVEGSATGFASSSESLINYLTEVHNADPSMKLLAGMPAPETMFYTFGEDIPIGRSQFIKYGNKLTTLLEAPPANIVAAPAMKGYYKLMWQLSKWGQKPTTDEVDLTQDFAAAYVRGNYHTIADVDTDKYYIQVSDAPLKNNDVVYNSMFGVTKYSVDAERAAEVIELFNTNKKFRNLMYYGVQDVHYMIDEKGEYVKLNNDWNMDIYDTGNLYLLERSKDLGDYYYQLSADNWDAGKDLNRDAVDGLLLGFSYDLTPELSAALTTLRTKFAEWNQYLLNYTGDDISGEISKIKDQIDAMDEFKLITAQEEDSGSVYIQYRAWYNSVAS